MINNRDTFQQVSFYAMLAAVLVGMYFRFAGLDKAPFWTDEYYLAQSINNVLNHWLPEYDCGGYYTRGLLIQYIAAPFFAWGSNDELYLRLITVISNLLAIIPLYLLARRVGGTIVACAVVILFSLSAWEVEMARFARMYAPFQAVFVWYIYLLHRVLFDQDQRALYWMYAISFLSVFVYEGAIFLVLLNFIPLTFAERYRQLRNYAWPLVLFVATYSFLKTDMRRLAVDEFLPPDYAAPATSGSSAPIELPDLFLSTFPSDGLWLISFVAVLVLCIVLASMGMMRELRRAPSVDMPALLRAGAVLMCVFFALLNLYALVAATGLLLYLLSPFGLGTLDRRSFWACATAVAITLMFWLVYAASTHSWQALPDTDKASDFYRLMLMLFNYPPIGFKIVGRWMDAMPVLTIALGFLIGASLLTLSGQQNSRVAEFRMLVALVVVVALAMAVLYQLYVQIRYTFFLYPLVLVLALTGTSRLADWMSRKYHLQQVSVLVALVVLIVIGEDYNFQHLWNIDAQKALYRQDYDRPRANQYYNRYDSRSPAEYVNSHRTPNDIVITSVVATPYYLDHLDYFYLSEESHKFAGVVGCQGQRHLWSNARMIYKPDDVKALLTQEQRTVWLIIQSRRQSQEMPELGQLVEQYRDQVKYVSPDGTIEVIRIPTDVTTSDTPPEKPWLRS